VVVWAELDVVEMKLILSIVDEKIMFVRKKDIAWNVSVRNVEMTEVSIISQPTA
jgi:hypothetical protein